MTGMEKAHAGAGDWYVMRTVPGREQEAADLVERTIAPGLWRQCRILKKEKLFRVEGKLLLSREDMFPGYLFIETDRPGELKKVLERSREYPRLLGDGTAIIPVEKEDLGFLKNACGDRLQHVMSLSRVEADGEGNLIRIEGILKPYEEKIIRKRLRKRYVLAEVELFRRKEKILFGIYLPGDRIWRDSRKNTAEKTCDS